jgi:lycopene cyclase domain-containing protein
MDYLTFHLIFLVPAITGMLLAYRSPPLQNGHRRVKLAIPLVCLIAVSYTTPWDNYLVAQEIWWYGPNRVYGTIGHVPIEEYLFFVLQPLFTGLFLYQYLGRIDVAPKATSSKPPWVGTALFGGLAILGAFLLGVGHTPATYLSLILIWAPPILAGMWLYDGETLWAYRKTLLITTALPTLYLWVADAIAIRVGIWTISQEYTLGVSPFGLPIEEASFFLFTNLLVVKGILLLLYGSHKTISRASPTR